VVTIKGIETAECPVSLISAESNAFLNFYYRIRAAKEATGGVAGYGPDLGVWPARLVEAMTLLEVESSKAQNASLGKD